MIRISSRLWDIETGWKEAENVNKREDKTWFWIFYVNFFYWSLNVATSMGCEPTRAKNIGLAVQRLNRSVTTSLILRVNTCMRTIKTNWNNWNLRNQRNKFWNSESPIDYVTEIPEDNLSKGITREKGLALFFFLLFLMVVYVAKLLRHSGVKCRGAVRFRLLSAVLIDWPSSGIDKLTFGTRPWVVYDVQSIELEETASSMPDHEVF